jgi:fluoride exporter
LLTGKDSLLIHFLRFPCQTFHMFKLLLVIGSGSFFGGIARFLTSRYIQNHAMTAFPLGTLIVNIIGCLLIGLFYGLSERGNLISAEWRMFLTAGFCGGFTTFSAFANENVALLREGDFFYFALYTSLSVFLGLMATYLGNLIIKVL